MKAFSVDRLMQLRGAAEAARSLHYAPYSKLLVLAAAETSSGVVAGGANVENVNFTLTKHAEEIAILAAFRAGRETPAPGRIAAVYVAGANPCGSCRQFALEFGTRESIWIVERFSQEELRGASLVDLPVDRPRSIVSFGDALPLAFDGSAPGASAAGVRIAL